MGIRRRPWMKHVFFIFLLPPPIYPTPPSPVRFDTLYVRHTDSLLSFSNIAPPDFFLRDLTCNV